MDLKKNAFKTVSLFLIGVILIIMLCTSFSTYGENKRLKKAVNENLSKIERLESEKNIIFESIKKDSVTILAKDAIILDLSKKKDSLINTLKLLKNERIKINAAYLSSDVINRVRVFSKLAAETDSIR